jgi:hypothetical protein
MLPCSVHLLVYVRSCKNVPTLRSAYLNPTIFPLYSQGLSEWNNVALEVDMFSAESPFQLVKEMFDP